MAKIRNQADAKKAGILTSTAVIKDVEPLEPSNTPFKSKGEMDEFGFGSKTQVSFVVAHLLDGSFTKEQIKDKFVEWQMEVEKGKGDKGFQSPPIKLSSLSVIYSDIAKPFGTYHASRSLVVITDETTKIVSLDPKRVALVKKAVAAGILNSLKGFNMKKHPDKVKTVLKKHGLPTEVE